MLKRFLLYHGVVAVVFVVFWHLMSYVLTRTTLEWMGVFQPLGLASLPLVVVGFFLAAWLSLRDHIQSLAMRALVACFSSVTLSLVLIPLTLYAVSDH